MWVLCRMQGIFLFLTGDGTNYNDRSFQRKFTFNYSHQRIFPTPCHYKIRSSLSRHETTTKIEIQNPSEWSDALPSSTEFKNWITFTWPTASTPTAGSRSFQSKCAQSGTAQIIMLYACVKVCVCLWMNVWNFMLLYEILFLRTYCLEIFLKFWLKYFVNCVKSQI